MPKRSITFECNKKNIYLCVCVMTKCEKKEVKTGGLVWKFSAHNFELIALYLHGGRRYGRVVKKKKAIFSSKH